MNRLNINNSNLQIPSNTTQNVVSTETVSSTSTASSIPPAALPLSSGVPPISNNVPPPPPPPPLLLKSGTGQKSLSFADQLKQTQLRNVTSNGSLSNSNFFYIFIKYNFKKFLDVNRTSSLSGDTGIGSKTSTINSTNSGHLDLLSELAATINKRKKANTNFSNTDAAEKRSNSLFMNNLTLNIYF